VGPGSESLAFGFNCGYFILLTITAEAEIRNLLEKVLSRKSLPFQTLEKIASCMRQSNGILELRTQIVFEHYLLNISSLLHNCTELLLGGTIL
jgi:hypothetical protein